MAIKFLTPVQLWQDYDPADAPLDISIEYTDEKDGVAVKGMYFTAFAEEGESVRAFAEVKTSVASPKRAILYVMNSACQAAFAEGFDELLAKGFAVMTIDVSGVPDKDGRCAKYSDGLSYASFAAGTPDRFLASPSAKKSPVFLWAKIARRAVSLLEYFYPKAKIAVVGAEFAADVAWQVAATDSRIAGLVALLGDYSDPPSTEEDSSNADSYMMTISAKSAARLLKCPCLIATAANAHGGDVEKVNEIACQLREGVPYTLVVTPRLNAQIGAADLAFTYKWLERTMKGDSFPEIKLSSDLQDGVLTFTVSCEGQKTQNATLYYTYNDELPVCRHWHELVMKKQEDGTFTADAPVWVGDHEVYAYAVATISGGLSYASKGLGTLVTSDKPYLISQFLLDTESDHGFYSDNSKQTYLSFKDDFKVADAPDGVPGFCGKGVLRTNILSEQGRYEPATSLHLSAYSKTEGEIRVVLLKEEEGKVVEYMATCFVEAGEWTRLSLEVDDFKTKDLIPMKDWEGLYSILLPDTDDKYYNNFLWM
ncbi:MAG: hypothetical protein J5774_02815 [Clostridia bacterium]|nr:hypothetical protein [Clostridia bacterium]